MGVAMPKSVSRTRPSGVTSTLPGLTSRWNDARRVGGVEGIGQGDADPHSLGDVERALVVEHLAQREARHVLHDDGLVAVLADGVVDRHDPRVVDAGDGDRLAAEAVDEHVVGGQIGVEQLDRDLAVEHLVGAQPDLRHPADREAPVEAVAIGEAPGAHRWGRRWRELGRGHGCRRR